LGKGQLALTHPAKILLAGIVLVLILPRQSFAEWTKTIECPGGREYRDIRFYASREEYCELLLPGSLRVKDGPYRSWNREEALREEGLYQKGRKLGAWTECDRFDRCGKRTYPLLFPGEHATAPELPISYSGGKYTLDFKSCWSTWITWQNADSRVELNVGGDSLRCHISYIPSFRKEGQWVEAESYVCEIPYAVGVRQFDSLDLRNQFVKARLPQFCRTPGSLGVAIWSHRPIRPGTLPRITTIASLVDVECAVIQRQPSGVERLTVRFNEFVERLVLDDMRKNSLSASTCNRGPYPSSPIRTMSDKSGRTLFTYDLSSVPAIAKQQRQCIVAQVTLQASCTSP